MLELTGCPAELLDDLAAVEAAVRAAADAGMSTLLKVTSHRFEPSGVTVLGLLAESHISVHTWPEEGYAAADVFTCGETAQPKQACQTLAKMLSATDAKLTISKRGMPAARIASQ